MDKINLILNEVLKKIEPSKEEINILENALKKFKEACEKKIKKEKLKVDFFVGGSFAKKTLIRKGIYDLDIFFRFDSSYENKEISNIAKKILEDFENVNLVHGSRDYFQIKVNDILYLEIIPVKKFNKIEDSENITDLSYSHVKYVRKKITSQKVLDDIKLAKAFCHAHNCYGAESYIKGFSGYGLELLVYHYGSFLKFIKTIIKIKDKLVIDIEKQHKNKQVILMDLNSAKLESPIILIDPTYKQRNVLAALSQETLNNFKIACEKFLKNPSLEDFELKKIDFNKEREIAKSKKQEFVLIETKTSRQEGDIAGSKLLKFYKFLSTEIEKYFDMKKKGFEYGNEKFAKNFFSVKAKKEILFEGPFLKDEKNLKKFKKEHKKTFEKKGKIYAKEKIDFDFIEFLKKWEIKNKQVMKDMSIDSLNLI